MAAGGIVGGVPRDPRAGRNVRLGLPGGDQRAMGRAAFKGRAGFSPGGFSIQNDETGDMLKYIADVSRTGEGTPRKTGFAGVHRRR